MASRRLAGLALAVGVAALAGCVAAPEPTQIAFATMPVVLIPAPMLLIPAPVAIAPFPVSKYHWVSYLPRCGSTAYPCSQEHIEVAVQ